MKIVTDVNKKKKLNLNHDLNVYESIVDLISDIENPTPLVRLNEQINPQTNFSIYIKLERYNPFGSIKDRIAYSMLKDIKFKKNQHIIEPSSGNTGIALASLANARGIPIEIAVPSNTPEEKKTLLKILGVNVLWEAEDTICPKFPTEGARLLVKDILNKKTGKQYFNPNQYENYSNVLAHYRTTGPEIWHQTGGKIDHFFAAIGTGGTITGIGKYLKERNPSVKIIGIEPLSSTHNISGMKRITDLDDDLKPKILNESIIDEIFGVDNDNAYRMAIKLARKNGILVGPSTGAILSAALKYGKNNNGLAVIISPDDAYKYISCYAEFLDIADNFPWIGHINHRK